MNRVAVFVDGGYLDKVLEYDFGKAPIDYAKLAVELAAGQELLRVYYYFCMPFMSNPPTDDEKQRYQSKQRFIHRLALLPRFELRQGRLERRGSEFEQKRVDTLLTVDLVRLRWRGQISRAVLVTGDSDFVPAIKDAKDSGVLVQLYYSKRSCHQELLQACDDRIEITHQLIDRILRTR